MRSLRHLIVPLTLCLSLVASMAWAAGGLAPSGRERSGLGGLLQALEAFVMSVWGKTGCEIDPLGRCGVGGSVPATDGQKTRPVEEEENAGHIDPFGGSSSSMDGGCEIDPFGRCGSR